MNVYPSLMETDLERFELLFTYKKKTLEEFLNMMIERADLEENYAKAIDRISANLSIYTEKGPLAEVMNSMKSYNAIKSEQSRTLASSIKEDIVQTLKDLIKKETSETRIAINNGKKNDLEMRLILEKIENIKRKYLTVNTDIEETQKTKALLFNIEMNDPSTEDRRRNIVEKLNRLVNTRFDCDVELKASIEEYNKFKTEFTEQSNVVVEHFKKFDATRLNSIRDSVMKFFVYEISYVRNIQYDVNRIIGSVENAEVAKDVAENVLYKPKQEPSSMDFENFKEMFINKKTEGKSKSGIIFEKTQIPDNLGLSTAFKSIVGFFAPKGTDLKKKEEDAKFIEKYWKFISSGQQPGEPDQQIFAKMMALDYNRRLFIGLFSQSGISLESIPSEQYEQVQDVLLQALKSFLVETWQSKDWESLKLYVSSMRKLKKNPEKEEQKEDSDPYTFIDENLRSLEMFNNEAMWREYLYQNIVNKTKLFSIEKLSHEISNARHFVRNKDYLRSLIRSAALDFGISEQNTEKLMEEHLENTTSDYSSEGSQDRDSQTKENEKEEIDVWMQKMQNKMPKVEKKARGGISIFAKKNNGNPLSPLANITSTFENSQLVGQSDYDKVLSESEIRRSPLKHTSSIIKSKRGDNDENIDIDNDDPMNIENSYPRSISREIRDISPNNL